MTCSIESNNKCEGLIEACKHKLAGLELEFLEHLRQSKDLDELLKVIDDLLCDARNIETHYHDTITNHKHLKAKLNEVIADIMDFRREVKVIANEGHSELINEILNIDSDWRKAGIVENAEEAEAE